jgi:ribose-phosphate pyrophosphokinase
MPRKDSFVLLTGRANEKLANDIAKLLKTKVHNPISKFSDGETRVKIPINLRNRDVFIIQPTCPPEVDSYFIELLLMIDAARRASANKIYAVIPYLGYSRQDRKEGPRVPISSAILTEMIEYAGVTAISTVDLHSEPQQGFIRVPVDNLYGSYSLVPKLKAMKLKNLVVASPDKGGVPKATAYAKFLKADGVAIVYKERDLKVNNQAEALEMIGDVKDKNVLIVDDIADTAGTICEAANLIKKRGAKSIIAAVTHGLLTGPAVSRINESAIERMLVTDTVPLHAEAAASPKIKVVTIAPLLAEAIRRTESGDSISSLIL